MKFYSETLDKIFDTEKALLDAEAAAKKAALEKERKAAAKKEDAKLVEEAFKLRNAAKREFNSTILARRKKYAEDLAALKTAYEADIEAASKLLTEAETMYDSTLKTFIEKHPEGYHMTLKDGDHVVTYSSAGNINNMKDKEIYKEMLSNDWFDNFFNLFRI
jgi:hypothetical protein